MGRRVRNGFVALVLVTLLTGAGSAQNLLANPGFETGDFTGWSTFVNCFVEAANPPQFTPNNGNFMVSMFGPFAGVFGVSGIFQSFPAAEGDTFEMDAFSRHWAGDALTGVGSAAPTSDNWVVMKIAFFDATNTEIAGFERTILDGTFAVDIWHDNQPVQGTAPANTASVQALVLYLQPAFLGGAGHIDDVEFRQVYNLSVTQDMGNLDLTVATAGGTPLAQFANIHSFDPTNGTSPGTGVFGGLHISTTDLLTQINLAIAGVPLFGGLLDGAGASTTTVPGAALVGLTGLNVWSISAFVDGGGTVNYSNIVNHVFL